MKVNLTDLNSAAAFTLWGFRALANGCHNCGIIKEGYGRAFGSAAETGFHCLQGMVFSIAHNSRRRIQLYASGCINVTCDELSLLAAIEAAQNEQDELLEFRLSWLLGTAHVNNTSNAIKAFGLILKSEDLRVKLPDCATRYAQHRVLQSQFFKHSERDNVRTLH